MRQYRKMAGSGSGSGPLSSMGLSLKVVLSYAFDWVIIVVLGVIALCLGFIPGNKRPFSLNDPNISFPFTEKETVPPWLLLVLNAAVPIGGIVLVSLLLVPGATVPANTPKTLIWKRKIWELHVGLLGLALALVSAWFFTQGMKNLFGKPRPDLLARCEPDFANAAQYLIGGFAKENQFGTLLYSAKICMSQDHERLDDGFRSYPSGHASSAAAGLVYLSLFFASKFAVTIPFVIPNANTTPTHHSAFPSRVLSAANEPLQGGTWDDNQLYVQNASHNKKVQALRQQAAAPPLYLLALTLIPFAISIFISGSRWWDFRHHGFDIIFGYLMGLASAVYSFRYYHLPIQEGAGWAWGPRSRDRAFWAGVGRVGYAGNDSDDIVEKPARRFTAASSNDVELQQPHATQRPTNGGYNSAYGSEGPFSDLEMQRMDNRL